LLPDLDAARFPPEASLARLEEHVAAALTRL
jgi:hypothetical protein